MNNENPKLLNTPEQILEFYIDQYQNGEKAALLHALRLCCVSSSIQTIPETLSSAVVEAIDKWFNFDVATLDEALSIARPKGTHLKAKKKKKEKQSMVFTKIYNAHQNGRPIDHSLFEEVGNEFAISPSLARDWYYEFLPTIKEALKQIQSVSRKT